LGTEWGKPFLTEKNGSGRVLVVQHVRARAANSDTERPSNLLQEEKNQISDGKKRGGEDCTRGKKTNLSPGLASGQNQTDVVCFD